MASLHEYVLNRQKRSDVGAKCWSMSYHLAFGVAGVLGIIVSLIAARGPDGAILWMNRDSAISAFSALAAILTFVGGFGGFERKWRANRWMRAEMDKLLLDLTSATPDVTDIRTRLFAAIDKHESSIPGEMGSGAKMAADAQFKPDSMRKPDAEAQKAADEKKAAEARKAAG